MNLILFHFYQSLNHIFRTELNNNKSQRHEISAANTGNNLDFKNIFECKILDTGGLIRKKLLKGNIENR